MQQQRVSTCAVVVHGVSGHVAVLCSTRQNTLCMLSTITHSADMSSPNDWGLLVVQNTLSLGFQYCNKAGQVLACVPSGWHLSAGIAGAALSWRRGLQCRVCGARYTRYGCALRLIVAVAVGCSFVPCTRLMMPPAAMRCCSCCAVHGWMCGCISLGETAANSRTTSAPLVCGLQPHIWSSSMHTGVLLCQSKAQLPVLLCRLLGILFFGVSVTTDRPG